MGWCNCEGKFFTMSRPYKDYINNFVYLPLTWPTGDTDTSRQPGPMKRRLTTHGSYLVMSEVLCLTESYVQNNLYYDISGIMLQKRPSAFSSIRAIEPLSALMSSRFLYCKFLFWGVYILPKIFSFLSCRMDRLADNRHRETGRQPLMLLKSVRSRVVVTVAPNSRVAGWTGRNQK